MRKYCYIIILITFTFNCNAQLIFTKLFSFTLKSDTVFNPITGKYWLARNLGASQVATSSTDAAAYGDLYQWGRGIDGHQLRNSSVTATLSSTDSVNHAMFIRSRNTPYDWRSPQNYNLWQGVYGINNPCPTGFRIPTQTEWNAEIATWSSQNAAGAFASVLKLPLAGAKFYYDGSLAYVDTDGRYWSSTIIGTNARPLRFDATIAGTNYYHYRSYGYTIRCIKN